MGMKIDEVINAVLKRHFAWRKANRDGDPVIAVYMTHGAWQDCMAEIHGEVSSYVNEFFHYGTVHGYPVHRVLPDGWGRTPTPHPPFQVVVLN